MGGVPPSRPRGVHDCGHPSAWSANLELCDHGFVHRTSDAACPLPPHPEEGGAGGMGLEGNGVRCLNDAECAANEYCVLDFTDPVDSPPAGFHREKETHCQSACVTNDDCASGEVCSCNPTFVSVMSGETLTLGVCAPAGCHTDSDCANGRLCVASLSRDRLESSCETEVQLADQFRCQSERDECSGPADCDWLSDAGEGGRGPLGRLYCPYSGGHRSCAQGGVHPECEW